jgi:hypothetical protein
MKDSLVTRIVTIQVAFVNEKGEIASQKYS